MRKVHGIGMRGGLIYPFTHLPIYFFTLCAPRYALCFCGRRFAVCGQSFSWFLFSPERFLKIR
jgi:hypothetical protein